MEDDDEEEEEAMDEEGGSAAPGSLPGSIPITDCLFCSQRSRSLLKNVAHMTKVHSFFIPDVEFLLDLKGLIRYLGGSRPKTGSAFSSSLHLKTQND